MFPSKINVEGVLPVSASSRENSLNRPAFGHGMGFFDFAERLASLTVLLRSGCRVETSKRIGRAEAIRRKPFAR